jgi:hypothetical protein
MDRQGAHCDRCGHPLHEGAEPDPPPCAVSGCDCAEPVRRSAPSLSYSIDPDAGLVRLVFRGAASFEEWQRTMEAVRADPAYRPGASFLVDRHFDEPASPDFAVRWIRFLWLHVGELAGSRFAIVTLDPRSYGVARAQKALGFDLPISIEIFTELEKAERWLRSEGPRPE